MQEPVEAMEVLRFNRPLLVVGGGSLDQALLRSLAATGAAVIGADGGADAVAAAGLVPDAVIGDFDSVASRDWPASTRLLRIAEQETTDFEKCLYSTEAPVTVALGVTGGRFDHTLAALDAVTRHARHRVILLVDVVDVAMALSGPHAFRIAPGERVSVHPLLPLRFARSEGLEYPLDGLRLAAGERTGTSNRAVAAKVVIVPEPGDDAPWLLILDRKHVFDLLARFRVPPH